LTPRAARPGASTAVVGGHFEHPGSIGSAEGQLKRIGTLDITRSSRGGVGVTQAPGVPTVVIGGLAAVVVNATICTMPPPAGLRRHADRAAWRGERPHRRSSRGAPGGQASVLGVATVLIG
jgi:hypothetical protein